MILAITGKTSACSQAVIMASSTMEYVAHIVRFLPTNSSRSCASGKTLFVISYDGHSGGIRHSLINRESWAEMSASQSFPAVRPARHCGII